MSNINLVVYFKHNGGKYLKGQFYSPALGACLSSEEAYDFFREVKDADIEIRHKNKPLSEEKLNPYNYLLRMLKCKEPLHGDTNLLNRIIRDGGLTEYTKKLSAYVG